MQNAVTRHPGNYRGCEGGSLTKTTTVCAKAPAVMKTLLIMKLTGVLLLAACMQVSAAGYSQKVTISERDAPLQKIFQEIKKQTDYSFFFDESWLQLAGKVTIDVKGVSLENALELCFKNQPLTYKVIGKTVIVKLKEEPVITAPPLPEPIGIKGVITDEEGNPLQGVSVTVKGVAKGVATNARGEFTIAEADGDAVLIFSSVGYETQEIPIKSRKSFYLRLKRSNKALDETFVIGYGSTTKRYSTASVTKLTSEEIAAQPVTNVLQALEGRMPGVLATQSSGVTGAKVTVQIRGQNFIGNTVGRNDPLYIIDGVPFPSTALNKSINGSTAGDGATGETSPLNTINPADIESIEILKDADATAIFGSRGANGVILITTKKGKSGRTTFNANVWTGRSNVSHYVDVLSTDEYRRIRKIGFVNANVTPTAATAPDLLVWDSATITNFQKRLIGGSMHTTDANASVSGGDAKNKFLLSASYHKENTVFASDQGYNRASVLLNTEHTSQDSRFNISTSVEYYSDRNNLSATDPTSVAYALPPNYHLYNPDGSLYWNASITNPMAQFLVTFKNNSSNLGGHTLIKYTIIPGLDIKTSLGYNKLTNDQVRLVPAASYNPSYNITSGTASFTNFSSETFIIEPQATYSRVIGKGRLSVLAGGTWQSSASKMPFNLSASGFSSDDFLSDPQAATSRSVTTASSQYKYASLFGRVTYNFLNRYILNGTIRRDGSSRFGPDRRFGNFGAVGAAWLFSEEGFAKKIPGLSFGKLRGSYGVAGNDQIPDYLYASLYGTTTAYGTASATVPTGISNPLIHWETTRKLESAIDLGFLKDHILFSAAWYRNRSNNQLTNYTLSPQAGFTSYTANMPALVQNTGWEFTLTTINIDKGKFRYTTALNVTVPRNKLVSYPDLTAGASSSLAALYAQGYPLSSAFLYHYTGDDATTGLPTFADMDKSGTLTSGIYANGKGDYVYAGSTYPAFYGGLNNSLSYKGFQLDIFFQFTKQKGRSIATGSFYPPGNALYANMSRDLVYKYLGTPDKWDNNPKISQQYTASYTAYSKWAASDVNFVDASFVRLKNVNFSYSLPDGTLKKWHMQTIRFYIQGQNLFTITGYKGFDPETKGVSLPPLRTITGGIQVTL